MVSVDVKHHVHLTTDTFCATDSIDVLLKLKQVKTCAVDFFFFFFNAVVNDQSTKKRIHVSRGEKKTFRYSKTPPAHESRTTTTTAGEGKSAEETEAKGS